MKKIIAIIFSFITVTTIAQTQGIGVRLGEPMGITYKKYLGKTHAVEFGIGTSGPGWRQAYYENSFDNLNKFENYDYRSHQVKSTVYLQARYLIHNAIYVQDLEGKWDWYWGAGAVLKAAKVRYRYNDTEPPYDESEIHNDVDLGPEGIIGMEYTFEEVPLTVFGEVSLMLEIVDRVTFQPFAGAGVRYNF
jgi:hypothetical protein